MTMGGGVIYNTRYRDGVASVLVAGPLFGVAGEWYDLQDVNDLRLVGVGQAVTVEVHEGKVAALLITWSVPLVL